MKTDMVNILYTKQSTGGNKTHNALLIEHINKDTASLVDVPLMVSLYSNQLHKLFTLEKQKPLKSQLLDIEPLQDDSVLVRVETIHKRSLIQSNIHDI